MFGSEVIDVGIGMALLFLFMSLIATALREFIENIMKSRARDLERGIKELLQDRCDGGKTKEFYEHPLIASLYEGEYISEMTKNILKRIFFRTTLPSYIPRQSFSLALLDIVAGASKDGIPLSVESLRTSLAGVANPNAIQRVVQTAIDSAEGDLDRVRKTIEDWYDGTMDRVSGWYTRRTGKILGILGFLAAVFFNVDAITVAQSLIRDKSLREAVVAQAEQYVRSEPAEASGGQDASPSSSPAGNAVSGKPGGQDASPPLSPVGGKAGKDLISLKGQLDEIGFPIGWTWTVGGRLPYPAPQTCKLTAPPTEPLETVYSCQVSFGSGLMAFFGWIITALAIMLGAPFWFDVLNKFMVIRSTVKPKEKSPDQSSADRQHGGLKPSPDAGDTVSEASAVAAALAVKADAFEPHAWANDSDPQRGGM